MSKLKINLESPSHFLRDHISFEIRDGSMKLIDRVRASELRDIQLMPGLYQVSAVLQDGKNHIQIVEMSENRTVTFHLGEKKIETEAQAIMDENTGSTDFLRSVRPGIRWELKDRQSFEGTIKKSSIELEGITDARVREKDEEEKEWIFEPTTDDSIPLANFRVGLSMYGVSLPTNPLAEYPYNACSVVFKDSRPNCWISPERVVGNTLQHWLFNGQIQRAADVANDATHLLQDKYKDPTAALLGALILFRFGRLEERRQWVGNLAESFSWLTDARILHTVLEAPEAGPSLSLLEEAINYSGRRILFTESYSILINLLRNWPGQKTATPEFNRRRLGTLERLAEQTVNVDWSAPSMTFSRQLEAQEGVLLSATT